MRKGRVEPEDASHRSVVRSHADLRFEEAAMAWQEVNADSVGKGPFQGGHGGLLLRTAQWVCAGSHSCKVKVKEYCEYHARVAEFTDGKR
jgi:hypothetical protein